MATVRVKGVKRYRVKGKWFAYHRKTGIRIKAEFGTGEFFAELAALERKLKTAEAIPGTLGLLFSVYRASSLFTDLAPASQHGYGRMINLVQSINDMPLVELTPQFVAGLRDRIASKHGRRQANYVMAVISVACEFGKEHGIVRENPVKGVRRVSDHAIPPMPIDPGPRMNVELYSRNALPTAGGSGFGHVHRPPQRRCSWAYKECYPGRQNMAENRKDGPGGFNPCSPRSRTPASGSTDP